MRIKLLRADWITLPPTGLGQGEVLADEGLLSLSSGSSTDDILMFFADNRRRLCTGLEGAANIVLDNSWTIVFVFGSLE